MADLNFEEKLWQAANKMRKTVNSAKYKRVVLGLFFIIKQIW